MSKIDSIDLKNLLSDSSRRTAVIAVSIIGNNPIMFKEFLDFALQDNGRFSMRAARVVQLSAHHHPELIRPYLNEIIQKLPTYKNDGLKRGMLKLLTERSLNVNDETIGILVQYSFRCLMDPIEKPAMKAYSIEILYKISQFYPDIQPELISAIEDQMIRSTNAVKSIGKKVLTKLQKQRD
jgi:hypothetical protein